MNVHHTISGSDPKPKKWTRDGNSGCNGRGIVVVLKVVLVVVVLGRPIVIVCRYCMGGNGVPGCSVHVVAIAVHVRACPRAPSTTHWHIALNSSSPCSGISDNRWWLSAR